MLKSLTKENHTILYSAGKFLSLLEDKKKISLQYKHHLFTILFIDSLLNPMLNSLQ